MYIVQTLLYAVLSITHQLVITETQQTWNYNIVCKTMFIMFEYILTPQLLHPV